MGEIPQELEYLREPRFIGFGAEVFRSSLRLPVLGAIFELTPVPESDVVYARQIIWTLDTDAGNTLREIQRAERANMIARGTRVGLKKQINYTRTQSPRWDIVEVALRVAKEELGINP